MVALMKSCLNRDEKRCFKSSFCGKAAFKLKFLRKRRRRRRILVTAGDRREPADKRMQDSSSSKRANKSKSLIFICVRPLRGRTLECGKSLSAGSVRFAHSTSGYAHSPPSATLALLSAPHALCMATSRGRPKRSGRTSTRPKPSCRPMAATSAAKAVLASKRSQPPGRRARRA